MPTNRGSQIQNLSGRYLNAINDANIGGLASSSTASDPYPGQLGQTIVLGTADAAEMSSTASGYGTLYQGEYQYVLRASGDATTIARGNLAFWDDAKVYQVTGTYKQGCLAGVFLGPNPLAGKYGFIQRGGLAAVLFASSITKATPTSCDLVLAVSQASKGFADILADATQPTWAQVRERIGKTYEAPTVSAVSLVELEELFRNS